VVRRTVAELSALLDRRERALAELRLDSFDAYRRAQRAGGGQNDPYGEVFLVIDGLQVLRQEFDALEPAVTDLAARGLGSGIHVVVTANRWIEIRPALRDLLGTRFELRLGEPFESEMHRRAAANVPERQPGRGITAQGLHFAAALPRIDGIASAADLASGIGALVAGVGAVAVGPPAPPVRLLPERLPLNDLRASCEVGEGTVAIGVDEEELAPVELDFAAEPHLVVLGDSHSGKSNLLRLVADAVSRCRAPDQARIIAIDYRRALFDSVHGDHLIGYAASRAAAEPVIADAVAALRERLPGPDTSAEQLRAGRWWQGAELYLLVDDYELVDSTAGNPLHPLLELVPQARDVGLHIVLARSCGGAGRALYEPLLQRIKDTGSPILALSGSRDEPAVIEGVRFQPLPPGRGTLVSRRLGTRMIQTAILELEPR
jgi:DNA segregation ATPase FtsK/SpoIIIE, S-DNA-T family